MNRSLLGVLESYLRITCLGRLLLKPIGGRSAVQEPDHRHLLRSRRERPSSSAAEQHDEVTPSHGAKYSRSRCFSGAAPHGRVQRLEGMKKGPSFPGPHCCCNIRCRVLPVSLPTRPRAPQSKGSSLLPYGEGPLDAQGPLRGESFIMSALSRHYGTYSRILASNARGLYGLAT